MRKVVIDTETTGLSPEKDKIIEIALIELDEQNRLTGNFFHTFVNPEKSIPRQASLVHGIRHNMIKNAPTFSEIKDDLLHFIEDKELISYYLSFNIRMLNYELGFEVANKTTDILKLAKETFPNGKCNLKKMMQNTKIKRKNIFNIPLFSDCYDAYLLYQELSRSIDKQISYE